MASSIFYKKMASSIFYKKLIITLITTKLYSTTICKKHMHRETARDVCQIWIYAGVFSGWWCYDDIHNIQINKIYEDYCARNNINNDISLTRTKNMSQTNMLTTIPRTVSKKNLSVFDPVTFDCNTSMSIDEEINCINEEINYIINTEHGNFRIDFENLKQINVSDPKKQRGIKKSSIDVNQYFLIQND